MRRSLRRPAYKLTSAERRESWLIAIVSITLPFQGTPRLRVDGCYLSSADVGSPLGVSEVQRLTCESCKALLSGAVCRRCGWVSDSTSWTPQRRRELRAGITLLVFCLSMALVASAAV